MSSLFKAKNHVERKESMKKMVKRIILYVIGLLVLALGINISKAAQLGISPVSAIPYACELIWGIELGKASIMVYIVLMALQVVLLRKNYKPKQLLQILCTYILGFFITYTGREHLLSFLPIPTNYFVKLIYLFISIIVIGIGVSLYLIPNLIPLPAEGLMNAIVEISNNRFKFSNVKVAVDSSLVLTSALLSLIFLGELKSVREGTVLAALLVGKTVGFIFKHFKEPILKWLEGDVQI